MDASTKNQAIVLSNSQLDYILSEDCKAATHNTTGLTQNVIQKRWC